MAKHHPPDELLLDYAAGNAAEPLWVIVRGHLELCPECRAQVAGLESVGGALLDETPPEPLSEGSFAATLARREEAEVEAAHAAPAGERVPDWLAPLPRPLRERVVEALAAGGWKRRGFGVSTLELAMPPQLGKLRLIRIAGGRVVPSHVHHGTETSFVVDGGFGDESGYYDVGDVVVLEDGSVHRVTAVEDEGCIMLTLNEGPVAFRGFWGALLNLFVKD